MFTRTALINSELYSVCHDDDFVYFQWEDTILKIPTEYWEVMRTAQVFKPTLLKYSVEELQLLVEEDYKLYLEFLKSERNPDNFSDEMRNYYYGAIFGSADTFTPQQQLANALEYVLLEREKEKKMQEKIESELKRVDKSRENGL